jgi:hypothetical protein
LDARSVGRSAGVSGQASALPHPIDQFLNISQSWPDHRCQFWKVLTYPVSVLRAKAAPQVWRARCVCRFCGSGLFSEWPLCRWYASASRGLRRTSGGCSRWQRRATRIRQLNRARVSRWTPLSPQPFEIHPRLVRSEIGRRRRPVDCASRFFVSSRVGRPVTLLIAAIFASGAGGCCS